MLYSERDLYFVTAEFNVLVFVENMNYSSVLPPIWNREGRRVNFSAGVNKGSM